MYIFADRTILQYSQLLTLRQGVAILISEMLLINLMQNWLQLQYLTVTSRERLYQYLDAVINMSLFGRERTIGTCLYSYNTTEDAKTGLGILPLLEVGE